jgi:hypothetical protein
MTHAQLPQQQHLGRLHPAPTSHSLEIQP